MEFTPKTREQAEEESRFPIWEAGYYDFEVAKAEELKSEKTKRDMIKLTLKCFSQAGEQQLVFDYLMPDFPLKMINACDAMGLADEYCSGRLEGHYFEGKFGTVKLGVRKESTDKATGKKYNACNQVEDYIFKSSTTTKHTVDKGNAYQEDLDDELPPF